MNQRSRHRLLALIAAAICGSSCSDKPTELAPVPGSLVLHAVTSGESQDVGYLVFLDDQPVRFLLASATITVNNLSPTQHSLRVAGVAPNCALSKPATRSVTIPNGALLTDSVEVSCTRVTQRIMFGSSVENRYNQYIMNGGGSNVVQFTTDTAYHGQWSPDGSHVVYMSPKSGSDQIYAVDSSGANETQLTSGSTNHDYPQWSPDGARIAYTSGSETWTIAADGSDARQIYANGANGPVSWSPDGTRIAQGSVSDILIVNADGTNPQIITQSNGFTSTEPAWSPDGTRIAFLSNKDQVLNLYVMNADGSGIVALTTSSEGSFSDQAAWSPDGLHIAFRTNRDVGHPEIYVMNPDGSNQTKITTTAGDNYGPSWHP
jgi:Tol biopolymer transport system component